MFGAMADHYSPPSRDELYFTSHVPTQMMTGFAIPGLFFMAFLLYVSAPMFYYVFLLLYFLFIPLPWYIYSYRKSNTPLYDTDIQSIVSGAESKLGVSRRIKLYRTEKKSNLLTSARTPFVCGILLSDRAVELIKERPGEGEIVLAHELALLKRDHLWLASVRNLAVVFYAILTEGLILLIEPLLPLLSQPTPWIFFSVLCYPFGVGIFIRYCRKSAAELEIELVYGMNPQLAMFHVFSRKGMSDAGRRFYVDEIRSSIESRKSRTAFVSLGVTLIASLCVSALVYLIFITILMPLEFAILASLLLGGLSFSFGVYHFESKGTKGLKRPNYSVADLPRSTDAVSVEVERILSMKVSIPDCRVFRYSFDDYSVEDEESGYMEAQIGDDRILIEQEEWDGLREPELIASYLVGGYTERRAGISSNLYSFVLLATLVLLLSGTVYLALVRVPHFTTFIFWILFCGVSAALFLFALNTRSTHRRTIALRGLARRDENYRRALEKLAESKNIPKYVQRSAKRALVRITSVQR